MFKIINFYLIYNFIRHIYQSTISQWKAGIAKPSLEAAEKIADYLDCSVDYLLGRTDKPEVNR